MDFEQIQILLKKGVKSLPEPELKPEWQKVFNRMVVHSRGVPPADLLRSAFPNEDDDIMRYREKNYEPVTTGAFDNGFDNLYRALSESNYSLIAPDSLKEYLRDLHVNNVPFNQFIFKINLRRKIEDPNGLLVVIPYGDGVTDPTKKVDAKFELVLSSQIIYVTEEVMIFKSCEKSIISVKGKGDKRQDLAEGDVYYAITDTDYFRYIQKGKKEDNYFEVEEYYTHNIGEKPYVVLGGRATGKLDKVTGEEQFYFLSDFNAFVAHANEALIDKSIHQGVKVTSAFPIRVMDEMPCDNKPACNQGFIYDEGGQLLHKCQRCKGTGNLIPTSVYKGIVLNKKKKAPFTDGMKENRPFEYIYPSTDILKLMGEECDNSLRKAKEALQSAFVEVAQSGAAKEMDRQDQYSMMYSFSDYFFEINYKKPVYFLYKLLNPSGKDQIGVIKPVSFKMKDESVLQAEFVAALGANVPMGILTNIYIDLVKKRFSGDHVGLRIEEVSLMYDPFYIYPIEKKNELLMVQAMKQNDYIKSTRITSVVWSIYRENLEKFFKLDDAKLVEMINKKMEPFLIPDKPPPLPAPPPPPAPPAPEPPPAD